MIPYEKSFIGFGLLFRVHGSPLFRSTLPGLMSAILVYVFRCLIMDEDTQNFDHPYGIGVLISSISFVIIFRANYGYQRYWSACGDTHTFSSKLLDAAVHVSVYHMQQNHYDCIKPPNYYDNHDLDRLGLSRDREQEDIFFSGSNRDQLTFRKRRAKEKSIVEPKRKYSNTSVDTDDDQEIVVESNYLIDEGRLDGGWGSLFEDSTSTFYEQGSTDPKSWNNGKEKGFASTYPGGRTPSLFLQELVHLFSLLNAVAFSTLRNEIEEASTPLDMYHPGDKFPKSDPKRHLTENGRFVTLKSLFGTDRTPSNRARYNHSRPLSVLGGVSTNEIKFLQRAKGASAKVALAHSWVAEFIIREDRAGTLGNVGPPIISRVMQFLSDAQIYYNHCRKTMFMPFPFPHAQLSAFFNITIIIAVPLLMVEYTTSLWLGSIITFMTVTCISGLHEVARELENPFKNIPNEIPLVTLQAMFNESLITVFAGYHPDHFWNGDAYRGNGEMPPKPFSVKKRELPQTRGTEEEMSIHQLRKMVMEQSDQIKRLTEMCAASTPFPIK